MWNRQNLRPQLVEYARLCEKRIPWCRITVSPSEPNEEALVIEPTAARPGWPSTAPPTAVAPFDTAAAKARQTSSAKHLDEPVVTTNSLGMKLP
ncbi:MAG: hypothetical protein KDA81_13860 [Planctomycetaceae bacterium]|nr:hypothetical protein [Planctomycetaceae bacterium]